MSAANLHGHGSCARAPHRSSVVLRKRDMDVTSDKFAGRYRSFAPTPRIYIEEPRRESVMLLFFLVYISLVLQLDPPSPVGRDERINQVLTRAEWGK